MNIRIKSVDEFAGILLIMLSIAVSIPLTIKVLMEGGGPWGFGIISLPILIPLCFYILFGITALIKQDYYQLKFFVATHLVTFSVGAIVLFIFPVYPTILVGIPLLLAVAGLINRSKYKYYLLLMIVLAIIANALLLKWEIDFHRAIPIVQLFEFRQTAEPL